MFFIKDNPRRIHSYQIRQLPCRARGTREHLLFSHLPLRMDDFVHEYVFSFCKSIDWCVQYKNNQTLDLLIKYVAYYHILFGGQLEICRSVDIHDKLFTFQDLIRNKKWALK